ncbi:hypothetical protein OR214_01691 [Ralstonia pickettii OR214]|uniref:Uncharacterized protein n=1 Tax=Ralstonia pickettii OR214 TaxID=1264675 RepID=R0EAA0_RALPI|nr:hypothetical protein OR214_01691 [Ralstonia pickettii OR214]
MSDLETLIPQAAELVIDGEPLAIKPLKVGQMPAFLRAITPVMQQIGGDGIDWLALFGERGDDLLTAVSIAVGKPRAWVDELAADEAILLAAKVIEVNAEFFYPDGDASARRADRADGRDGSNRHGWFDTVQHLIAHGHRLPDILDYTLAQVRGFAAATAREDVARDARLLSLIAIGARGDARHIDQTLDRLQDHAHLGSHR